MDRQSRTRKAAFAQWDGRIAPVFDVAERILVVESEAGRLVKESENRLPLSPPDRKAAHLVALGIETLVCGAVSRLVAEVLAGRGIRVVPFVAGELKAVVGAWLEGRLAAPAFRMPGCRGRGWGSAGRGAGEGVRFARGRMGGSFAAGTGGVCVCPKCGRREPHLRGLPCVQRACPQCGAAMVRE